MDGSPSPSRPGRRMAGMTLIELLLAMAISGFVLAGTAAMAAFFVKGVARNDEDRVALDAQRKGLQLVELEFRELVRIDGFRADALRYLTSYAGAGEPPAIHESTLVCEPLSHGVQQLVHTSRLWSPPEKPGVGADPAPPRRVLFQGLTACSLELGMLKSDKASAHRVIEWLTPGPDTPIARVVFLRFKGATDAAPSTPLVWLKGPAGV